MKEFKERKKLRKVKKKWVIIGSVTVAFMSLPIVASATFGEMFSKFKGYIGLDSDSDNKLEENM